MNKAGLALLLLVAGSPGAALAHPFTEETYPARFATVEEGITEVTVSYSEAVEEGFSVLRVYDNNGVQIDDKNTAHYNGEYSLRVTTPPLGDGAYLVTSKVLSKVDGHLVSDAFSFAIGNARIDADLVDRAKGTEIVFIPESIALTSGYVGQTIVLGCAAASLMVWRPLARRVPVLGSTEVAKEYHSKLMRIVGAGLVGVLASNVATIVLYSGRIGGDITDVLGTAFGEVWVARIAITLAIIALWFFMQKRPAFLPSQAALLALSLCLISTTTLTSHGLATDQLPAVVIDYVHNLVAGIWIGGVVFLGFVLLPALRKFRFGDAVSLALIPRFSVIFTMMLGAVIITGPVLMWMLESNVEAITGSTYGKLIIIKIAIASVMVAIGGYHQIGVQRRAEGSAKGSSFPVMKRLGRALKAETALGFALLGIVALLTNSSLPSGEVEVAEATHLESFRTTEYAANTRFDISMFPFSTGPNKMGIEISDPGGGPAQDISGIRVKISNPDRNITPIEIPVSGSDGKYSAEAVFSFAGAWQVEIEAQKTAGLNEGTALIMDLSPRLDLMSVDIDEFTLPEPGAPLHAVHDGDSSVWITDTSAPRIWRYFVEEGQFAEYGFDGTASILLDIGPSGTVWFTDTPGAKLGMLDPESGDTAMIDLPPLLPYNQPSRPISVDAAADGSVWVTASAKNAVLRYEPQDGSWTTFVLPDEGSFPFDVRVDKLDGVWFTAQGAGEIGYIDQKSGKVLRVDAGPLANPETITIDSQGRLWISEHDEGGGATVYDPLTGRHKKFPAVDAAALPNSVAFDRYGNMWFAQHTVDRLSIIKEVTGAHRDVAIPTPTSWVQFLSADNEGNLWFAEQKAGKIGRVTVSEGSPGPLPEQPDDNAVPYAHIASPLVAAGVVAASLFFVRAVEDKRRIDAKVLGGLPDSP